MNHPIRNSLLLLGGTAAAAALGAPRPTPHRDTSVSELVDRLRTTGLEGAALVNEAIRDVARNFPHHSVWHLWETPHVALRNGRGWSHQYNSVLAEVLRGLGLDVRLVHAARVRGFGSPWFFTSHAWVKVVVDGRLRDACASRETNTVERVPFVAVTEELPFRRVSRIATAMGLVPFVVGAVWRSWLTGETVPDWLYRERPSGA